MYLIYLHSFGEMLQRAPYHTACSLEIIESVVHRHISIGLTLDGPLQLLSSNGITNVNGDVNSVSCRLVETIFTPFGVVHLEASIPWDGLYNISRIPNFLFYSRRQSWSQEGRGGRRHPWEGIVYVSKGAGGGQQFCWRGSQQLGAHGPTRHYAARGDSVGRQNPHNSDTESAAAKSTAA